MNTTIEAVTEKAKEFLLREFTTTSFHGKKTTTLEIEIMADKIAKVMCLFSEQEHSLKCEEAGKEIDYVKFKVAVTDFYGDEDGPNTKCHLGANFSYGYFKDMFFKRLSLLQSQLEVKDKEIAEQKTVLNLQSIEISNLKFQVSESRAEVEMFAQWWDDNVAKLSPDEDWYEEGYRYRAYLSYAKSVRVKTFDELYGHFKSQLSAQQTPDKG